MTRAFIQPENPNQELVNRLGELTAERGWNRPSDQFRHLFGPHHCEMFNRDERWVKVCKCGAVIGPDRADYLQHLIEVLTKESVNEVVSHQIRGDVRQGEVLPKADGRVSGAGNERRGSALVVYQHAGEIRHNPHESGRIDENREGDRADQTAQRESTYRKLLRTVVSWLDFFDLLFWQSY